LAESTVRVLDALVDVVPVVGGALPALGAGGRCLADELLDFGPAVLVPEVVVELVFPALQRVDELPGDQLPASWFPQRFEVLLADDPVVAVLVAEGHEGDVEAEGFIAETPDFAVPRVLVCEHKVRPLVLLQRIPFCSPSEPAAPVL